MKGQEFDVFKLLISAMIAIAILMILQQVLNTIVNPSGNLKGLIIQQLQSCGETCSGISKEAVVNVGQGTKICYKDIKDKVSADSVKFYTSSDDAGLDDVKIKEINGVTTKDDNNCLFINENIKGKKATIYVSCDNGDCEIVVGKVESGE